MSVSGCRSSEETRVPVQPDEIITEPDQPDEARRVPDHPGTETQPTVDAILDAFWDEGITDLPHLDSQPVGQLPETAREAGTSELGEPSEPQPVSSKEKGKAPVREEEEEEAGSEEGGQPVSNIQMDSGNAM